jgi:glutathione S-transferase
MNFSAPFIRRPIATILLIAGLLLCGIAAYLAGPELTCADIMVAFNLTMLPLFGGRQVNDLANVSGYVHRIEERPAYVKAMQIAGPQAVPPT